MEIYTRARLTFIKFMNKNAAKILDVITPVWYLTVVIGLNWLNYDHIWDYIYGQGTQLSTVSKCTGWFLTGQMVLHWIFLCTVKSTYTNSSENNNKRLEHEKTFPHLTSEGVEYEELREKRPTLGTGNWSVITQYSGADVRKTAYPYWGWKPCIVCSCYKPARCHHCPICDVCVLKRDHHCFFARQCVGLNNQRYFVVFNFWATLLTLFIIPHLIYYTTTAVWPLMRGPELFLPWTLACYLIGWSQFYPLVIMFMNYSMIYFFLTAVTFLVEQIICIDNGLTSFEREAKERFVKTQCTTRYERFACVFGRSNIWLNFLVPYHWASEPTDDGITWDSMKKE